MVAHVSTVAFHGIEARELDVQVHMASGLPTFTVVGLPDKAVGGQGRCGGFGDGFGLCH